MFTRRSFLGSASAVVGAGVALRSPNSWAWALPENDPYLAKIGIQLYTLRNEMAKDPVKTLSAVADAGYKQIELMDVMDATQLMPIAKDKGLYATSAFLKWNLCSRFPKRSVWINATSNKTNHRIRSRVFN